MVVTPFAISDLHSLSVICFANIFSHPVACFLLFLTMSLRAEVIYFNEIQFANRMMIECKMVQLLWKVLSWQFLRKLPIHLSYGPIISLLGIYPRKMKVYVHIKIPM